MPGTTGEWRFRLLAVLSRHVGEQNAISMVALQREVFGEDAQDRINGTRTLRKLITTLRHDGVPLASTSLPQGGGYYLAAVGSELNDYLGRLRRRAVAALALESKIRRISLPELLGQIRLRLEAPNGNGSGDHPGQSL